MFIRSTSQRDRKNGQHYKTHRLVESYRNASGQARQRTLLNLGVRFSIEQQHWKGLADRIEELLSGNGNFFLIDDALEKEAQRIAKLVTIKTAEPIANVNSTTTTIAPSDFQQVDINSLEHRDVRFIGGEYVAYHAAKQLQLEQVLRGVGFNQKQAQTAMASIIARLIKPGSERATHAYLSEQSALDELLNVDFSSLPLNHLYSISDRLVKHQPAIETALYQREKDLFNLTEVVTLYDITNTYFEGRAKQNPSAQRGRSKEKRTDCPLVALGLVLDSSGFPKKSKIYPGNISEPKTMKEMLTGLGATENATVVMDAGFATDENIAQLVEMKYSYIVVSRRRNQIPPDDAERVIVKQDKHNTVTARLVENSETNELELYCHSTAKEGKTRAMRSKAEQAYEEALFALSAGLTKKGCTKKYAKILERLGRLKEKYSRVAQHYKVTVTADDKQENAINISWTKPDNDSTEHGVYCLRTNRNDLDEATFWGIYTMLTDLEAAFRSLKSELGMRPIYHQRQDRVDGHIFISILAYHLLHTLRYQLKEKGINASWQTLRTLLQTQVRLTSTLTLQDGSAIQIRKTSKPDANQSAIYQALTIPCIPGTTKKLHANRTENKKIKSVVPQNHLTTS